MIKKPSKRELRVTFDLYNHLIFEGSLPPIPIHWMFSNHYGEWCAPDTMDQPEKYPHGMIALSSKVQHRVTGWRGMLCHEMIHAKLWLDGDHDHHDEGAECAEHHSEAFTEWCNKAAKALDLPATTMEESWAWPWSYYDREDLDGRYE